MNIIDALQLAIESLEQRAAALSFAQKWADGPMPQSPAIRKDVRRLRRIQAAIDALKDLKRNGGAMK